MEDNAEGLIRDERTYERKTKDMCICVCMRVCMRCPTIKTLIGVLVNCKLTLYCRCFEKQNAQIMRKLDKRVPAKVSKRKDNNQKKKKLIE